MKDRSLTCRGFGLGSFAIPAFEVRPGESVSLLLPSWFELERELRDFLTGTQPRSEIKLAAKCVSVRQALPRGGIRGRLFNTMPITWLTERGLAGSQASAVLNRHAIEGRTPLSHLATTPRILLGLEAAYHQRPDVIVFAMSGLDPLGRRAVVDLVRTHLDHTGIVSLTYPCTTSGMITYSPFPESLTHEVHGRSPMAV